MKSEYQNPGIHACIPNTSSISVFSYLCRYFNLCIRNIKKTYSLEETDELAQFNRFYVMVSYIASYKPYGKRKEAQNNVTLKKVITQTQSNRTVRECQRQFNVGPTDDYRIPSYTCNLLNSLVHWIGCVCSLQYKWNSVDVWVLIGDFFNIMLSLSAQWC